MKLTNVYRQPSTPLHVYRFEFTGVKSIELYNSFMFTNAQLHGSTAHTLHKYAFLTKVIPYENIEKLYKS